MKSREKITNNEVPNRRRLLALKLGAVATSTIALLSGWGKYYSDNALMTPRIGFEYLLQKDCPPVSSQSVEITEEKLKQPTSSGVETAFEQIQLPGQAARDTNNKIFNAFNRAAASSNLTLVEYPQYMEEVQLSKNVNEVLDILNQYTSSFGVIVEIPTRHSLKDLDPMTDWQVADGEEINLIDFRNQAKSLINDFGVIPKELFEFSQLKRIKLVKNLTHRYYGKNAVSGFANPLSHTLYLDIQTFDASFTHELGHLLDYSACGLRGMYHDPGLTSLNTKGYKYLEDDPVNLWGLNTVSEYGATNQAEDKAEFYANILYGIMPDDNEPVSIQRKAQYLVARLEEHVPGMANYINYIEDK